MRAASLLLLLVLAGCAAPRAHLPPVIAAPPPPRLPAPVLAADWRDWPVSAGTWRYAPVARGSAASFGRAGAAPVAVLRCDRTGGRMFLSVAGAAPGTLRVRTSSVARALTAGATGGDPAYIAATLAPADPLLDAMAFSRGRFALSPPAGPPLVLPAWAELGRVVEDCRQAAE